MRIMLLSFSPKWYPALSSGRKIYEHRKRFCNEKVIAYIYLGIPFRQIVAKVELGEKIKMEQWLEEYKADEAAIERINDYLTRSKVAMPILSFQEIEPIDVRKMENKVEGFKVPISYMFIDNKPEVLKYIMEREQNIGEKIQHKFDDISSDDICRF